MRLFLAACAAFLLAGCTTTMQSADQAVADASARLQTICATEPAVHAAFLIFATDVSPRIREAEAQAHAVVTAICTNPPQNVPAALVTAAEAYQAVLEARAVAQET